MTTIYIHMDKVFSEILRKDIKKILMEALFGKPIMLNVNNQQYIGLVSKNMRPGELPYRISWFEGSSRENLTPMQPHIQLSEKEAKSIVDSGELPESVKEKFWSVFGKKLGIADLDPVLAQERR